MKTKLFIQTLMWCICVAGISILSGCEKTVVDLCEEQTNNRILKFKEYCYDNSGKVKLEHREGYGDTEWIIGVENAGEVYTAYHEMTGLQIKPEGSYEYSYQSEDRRYVCRIVGSPEAVNGKYASLYVWVEGCPEIAAIHFVEP